MRKKKYLAYIKESYNSIMRRKNTPKLKMGKRFKLTLHKKDIGIANKYVKRCSVSLGIRGM